MKTFQFHRPETVAAALAQLTGGAVVKAGGTDLLGLMKEGIASPEQLVSVLKIPELTGISERPGGGVSIGAATTLADIADHPLIGKRFPVLARAARAVGSPQLRNVGTIGGNLCQRPRCWYFRGDFHCIRKGGDRCFAFDGENKFHCVIGGDPCWIVHPSDTAVALVALNATLLVRGPDGQRPIPVSEFFVLPATDPTRETVLKAGELVTAIQVPGPPPGNRSVFLKEAERQVFDFATVSVAIQADVRSGVVTSARVALGGVAPIPWLEKAVSDALAGVSLSDDKAVEAAANRALHKAEPLAQNAYKLTLARNLIARAVTELR